MCAKAPTIGACANTYILKLVSFGYKMKLCVCIVTRDIGIHACIDAYMRYLTLPYPTLSTFTLHYMDITFRFSKVSPKSSIFPGFFPYQPALGAAPGGV